MKNTTAGYRELEHTADWQLEVWAPDLPLLLVQAATGMYALAGVELQHLGQPAQVCRLELSAADPESLLVRFLAELLYFLSQEGLGFDPLQVSVEGERLQAELSGWPLARLGKEIKAVTYHNLRIKHTCRGLEARIVFDV